jgi:hypothetical protein
MDILRFPSGRLTASYGLPARCFSSNRRDLDGESTATIPVVLQTCLASVSANEPTRYPQRIRETTSMFARNGWPLFAGPVKASLPSLPIGYTGTNLKAQWLCEVKTILNESGEVDHFEVQGTTLPIVSF